MRVKKGIGLNGQELKKIVFLAMAGILVIVSISGLGTQGTKGAEQVLQIKELMTPSEFKSCGLEKLSREELARLDTWLQLYTLRVVQVLTREVSPSTPDIVESRIEGTFTGWDGDTIFKLENGQIWQQSSYAYTYHYAYRPEVLIYKTDSRYKMKVEDVDETIYVKRLH